MTHKLIKTDNYLLVVDNSVHPYDSSKVGNPLAHLPLNGSPILEGVDLLPPYSRHQEDGIEDAVMIFKESWIKLGVTDYELSAFSEGYNKAREKYKYTDEDMRKAIDMATTSKHDFTLIFFNAEEILQSIHQYPTEFECEMVEHSMDMPNIHHKIYKPKTITTAQGVQWVGKYK
jgi:hypothetical protein